MSAISATSSVHSDPAGSPSHAAIAEADGFADEGSLLVEEQRFAIVPEWVIDARIPDGAFRLYALLLRYGNGSGHRMPARATLARRMNRSVDAVDRAMRQLVDAGLVRVEHRKTGKQYLSNRYHVRTSSPFPAGDSQGGRGGRTSAASPTKLTPGSATTDVARGGRTSTATPIPEGGRTDAATPGRSSAGRVAADVRHDREISTERTPPPPDTPPAGHPTARDATGSGTAVVEGEKALLDACGIDDLNALAERCVTARRALGQPVGRWRAPCLLVAIKLAVVTRGWPAADVTPALLAVAADPATISPVRVAEAGPWWDRPVTDRTLEADELADLEARLAELDGQRLALQRRARGQLTAEGLPVTRATVTRRACDILDRQTTTAGVAS